MALLETLGKKGAARTFATLNFVDPSASSIGRATFYVHTYYGDQVGHATVRSVVSTFEKVATRPIQGLGGAQVHLLSSIVDVEQVDLGVLSKRLAAIIRTPALVIVTTPDYSDARKRVAEFRRQLSNVVELQAVQEFEQKIQTNVFRYTGPSRMEQADIQVTHYELQLECGRCKWNIDSLDS